MRCLLAMFALALLPLGSVHAGARQDFTALRTEAMLFVTSQAQAAYPEARVDVQIGQIDPRLVLAHCPAPDFELSPGSNLWGAGNLAVSCGAPSQWSLYLTYRVSLRGPALLARRPLASGSVPGQGDILRGETEYAADPGRYPRDVSALRGAALVRPVAKGSPLTIDMLRVRPVIRAGQRVRVVYDGSGFQVYQSGIAQNQAAAGDVVRVKTLSGKWIQGVAQANGSVRVEP